MNEVVTLENWDDTYVARTARGDAISYVGYRPENSPGESPYFATSVAARDREDPSARRFVRLMRGTLSLDSFLPAIQSVTIVQDHHLVLPTGSDAYFGVVDRSTSREHADLTREIFGATSNELTEAADIIGIIAGRISDEYGAAGRVTFSRTRSNNCNLCGCLIPYRFPYLAFEQSGYRWGHVSLCGFYRLLAFLSNGSKGSPFSAALIDRGIGPDTLQHMIDAGGHYANPIPGDKI